MEKNSKIRRTRKINRNCIRKVKYICIIPRKLKHYATRIEIGRHQRVENINDMNTRNQEIMNDTCTYVTYVFLENNSMIDGSIWNKIHEGYFIHAPGPSRQEKWFCFSHEAFNTSSNAMNVWLIAFHITISTFKNSPFGFLWAYVTYDQFDSKLPETNKYFKKTGKKTVKVDVRAHIARGIANAASHPRNVAG